MEGSTVDTETLNDWSLWETRQGACIASVCQNIDTGVDDDIMEGAHALAPHLHLASLFGGHKGASLTLPLHLQHHFMVAISHPLLSSQVPLQSPSTCAIEHRMTPHPPHNNINNQHHFNHFAYIPQTFARFVCCSTTIHPSPFGREF